MEMIPVNGCGHYSLLFAMDGRQRCVIDVPAVVVPEMVSPVEAEVFSHGSNLMAHSRALEHVRLLDLEPLRLVLEVCWKAVLAVQHSVFLGLRL